MPGGSDPKIFPRLSPDSWKKETPPASKSASESLKLTKHSRKLKAELSPELTPLFGSADAKRSPSTSPRGTSTIPPPSLSKADDVKSRSPSKVQAHFKQVIHGAYSSSLSSYFGSSHMRATPKGQLSGSHVSRVLSDQIGASGHHRHHAECSAGFHSLSDENPPVGPAVSPTHCCKGKESEYIAISSMGLTPSTNCEFVLWQLKGLELSEKKYVDSLRKLVHVCFLIFFFHSLILFHSVSRVRGPRVWIISARSGRYCSQHSKGHVINT